MSKFTFLFAILIAGAAQAAEPFVPDFTAETPESKGGYEITPVLTIGGEDADEPAQFYERLGGVTVDGDAAGNLYVLDDGNHRVQVFDSSGKFVRSIGKEGQGPGEFQLPQQISVNASGQVAVHDMGQQRLSIFNADGSLLRDQIVSGPVRDIALTDDGSLVIGYSQAPPALVEWFDPSGKSVWKYGAKEHQGGNIRMVNISVGAVAPRLAITGSAVVAASADAYCIRPLDLSGREKKSFARLYERVNFELPKPKEGEDGPRMIMVKKTVEDGGGGSPAGGGGGPKVDVQIGEGDGEWSMDAGDLKNFMPEFEPDILGLLSWPDGRIWAITSTGDDDTMTIDEWTIDGRYTKRFETRDFASLAVGHDGSLYGVEHDENDFPLVHRLEVTPK